MIKCLITRPNHDKVTSYLFFWSKEIIENSQINNVQFLDLKGKDANREKVESYLKKQNPKVVLFNGHGSSTEIYGFKDEVLIKKDLNESFLKGMIIYSLSCSSADILGLSSIEKGAETFIGYKRSFILCTDKNRETTPLKDDIASSFLRPSNKLSLSILKGNAVKEASYKSREEFMKEIVRYSSTQTIDGSDRIVAALLWNMDNQIVLGNNEARIFN